MISYWEQESLTSYDHIVVGSGIVGLSTTIELKTIFPTQRVLVLERGLLPSGASSRNAGFACMGSVTELLDDLKNRSESEIIALFCLRKAGLERLRQRLGDSQIGYAENGSFELISETEIYAIEKINYLNRLLSPVVGYNPFSIANEKIEQFGFSPVYSKAMIQNHLEGELHTGKMMRALTDFAINLGVEIKTGANVINLTSDKNSVRIEVEDTLRKQPLALKAACVTLCTNGFTQQLFPLEDVSPGRGQVLITEPIPQLKFKGIFHLDCGYYYFREIDNRILIGGGRNLDFKTETTTEIALNNIIQSELENKLQNLIIPNTQFTVAQRWSGIMAFGRSKQPIVKSLAPNIFGVFRMGGMGVALGSEVAKQAVELIQQHHE
ncbi:MAG: FAD-binding oxidoreductase [Bacteroidetes bacterium]|nr:FAD-binding oxidoreductase [Bacteroidota bacterium]